MAGTLRPEQAEIILNYSGGKVGIAAVPGSGKTFTLAQLAARLIYDRRIGPEQEVLIVTFTNSAVNSFQARIARTLRGQYGLLPFVGYRVRTLHGLAHDIVRERPALVGLADDFAILDEKLALEIQRDIVTQRLPEWWDRMSGYLDPENDSKGARRAFEQDLPDLVIRFIKYAKDQRQTPEALLAALHKVDERYDLARFAANVYADYQRSLAYRGAVDFDDLVRLALDALERDERYLHRLRQRWPYILEDEAQDSSRLQEDMLRLLSGDRNWVRVGDPNQAINTTFTTANPRYLLRFLEQPQVAERPLSVSGRSAAPIVSLANELVRWTVQDHPVPDLRDAFEYQPERRRGTLRGLIQVTGPDDPQPNPLSEDSPIKLIYRPDRKLSPEKEREIIVSGQEFSLREWLDEMSDLPEGEQPTVAVLVPENSTGFKLVELLRHHEIPYEELLRSTTATRETVLLIQKILEYLSDPADLKQLKLLYWALLPDDQRDTVNATPELRQTLSKVFARWNNIEDFLWPTLGDRDLELDGIPEGYAWLQEDLAIFRQRLQRWLKATSLPVDQLVLTVAQDIFDQPVDVALGYKIAVLLRSVSQSHPEWRLAQFVEELRLISGNERRFIGFDDAEAGYEPKPGVVTVATMHAAKGLEWDRVYLLAVSSYGFPSAQPYDSYIGEKWYTRGSYNRLVMRLNLEAEAAAQLEALVNGNSDSYTEGDATLRARLDYSEERLRLLYVGITRAKRELVVSWNMGRFWQKGKEQENFPALPLVVLGERVEQGGLWE
ncbi:MAG: ATP-dependent helicase [Chloroflexi bacterium]|nr:ATP-dependent helicase [Chloroflexota bacterium]